TICIPGTIDRDMCCTEYTLGFDTAANAAMEAIDRIRDSSVSHGRCTVVEVMGRKRGYIALWAGMATSADAIILPEKWEGDFDNVVEAINRRHVGGKNNYLVVLAEGVTDANDLANYIQKETGIESRVSVLGYIQRGGSPTAKDRMYGSLMGAYAVEILVNEGRYNRIVAIKNDILTDYAIEEALSINNNELDSFQYKLSLTLSV
ncbi:MAG: 6-phosphofructokinase, partial [Lachnospiraceae bacterium]|nr:6-phosphofructokinase [Lachnospiraceae bacterium]